MAVVTTDPSFRGYLSGLANNGDQNATLALNYVGNDYNGSGIQGIDRPKLNEYNTAAPGGDDNAQQQAALNYLTGAYSQYGGRQLGDTTTTPQQAGSGGGAAAPNTNYDQQIGQVNAALGRLDNQQQVGESNVNTAYTDALNQLLGQKTAAQSAYDTSKQQSSQDFVDSKNQIGAGVGNQMNSLARLLGMHGAGSDENVAYANQLAAQQGNLQRNNVSQAFGRNNQALDTNFGNFNNDWNNSNASLSHQKDQNINGVDSQVASTRASLLQNLAQLTAQKTGNNASAQPFLDQSNALLSQVDNLGRTTPTFTTPQVAYQAPTLDAYTVNPNAAPTVGNQNAATDSTSPYLATLINSKNKQQQALI